MANEVVDQKLVGHKRRWKGQINSLRKRVERAEEELKDLRLQLEDRVFRLARRIARLEAASPAVQCQDGS